MSADHETLWAWRAARLRDAFDASFASPLDDLRPPTQRVLLVRVGGVACAVRLDECSGVHRASSIAPLPARHSSFIGLTTVGGAVLPVYDFAQRLGIPAEHGTAAWLLVSAAAPRVALLVAAIDGYAAIDAALADDTGGERLITIDGGMRRVISLAAVLESIDADSQPGHSTRSER